mmetsp:Transcript_42476/g.65136  ORF Transcript_42476/g.65136 Transcript_42476/m.65136 type:complete len:82 (-) Transcript_42476:321-566(-)
MKNPILNSIQGASDPALSDLMQFENPMASQLTTFNKADPKSTKNTRYDTLGDQKNLEGDTGFRALDSGFSQNTGINAGISN